MKMKAGCTYIILHVMLEGVSLVLITIFYLFSFLKDIKANVFNIMTFWYLHSLDTQEKLKQ